MRLNFGELKEPGVLPTSTGYLFTPLSVQKDLYFYFTHVGHFYCSHSYFIKRDYFSPILVVCVRAGCLHVQYQGSTFHLRKGDALFLDCQDPHYYYADMDGLEFFYVHFSGSNSHELTRRLLDTKGPLVNRDQASALSYYIENLMDFYDSDKTMTIYEESSRVYEIFRYLHGHTSETHHIESYIDTVTRYINDNIDRRISLQELASSAALSEYHFSRRFKRDTGYTPLEYVNTKKLDYGKSLLIQTDWPVRRIAEATGFSFRGFVTLFSHTEGCSPLVWRKKVQQHVVPDNF